MIKHLTLLLFLISTISVYSQDKFSLNNCVDYMFEHNKDLKNLKLVREQLEGWYSITKKSNLLPNISTSYRIADSWDQNGVGTLSNSWYAYTNVTVFNGARFPQIKKQKNTIVRHDIAIFWTESSLQRDLTILYYSAVLTKKQIEIIKNQIKEINDILATKIRNVDSTNTAIEKAFLIPLKQKLQTRIISLNSQYDNQMGIILQTMNKFDKDKMVLTDTLYFPKYHIKNKEAFLDTLLMRALPLQTQNERLNQDDRKYDIRIAKAYLYPTVSTGFEYRKDFVTQLPPKPAAYVDFSYNVFDWGVSNKKKQIAMLDYQIYQNNINQRKQEIDQMIKNNFYSMEQFLSLADPSVLDGYRKVYNIMKFKLLNGEYIISDFITAQNDYYTAVENYYINLRNAIEQEIRLRQTFNDYISPIEELGRNVVLIKDV